MSGWNWRRWTGVLGLVYVAIQVAGLVLFLLAGNPPDFGDAKKYAGWINSNSGLLMGDAYLTAVATAVLLMLLTGIRAVIREAGEDWEWAAALFFGAGLVTAAMLFVGAAAEATTAFVSGPGTDPAIVRAAWAGTWMALTLLYLPAAIIFATGAYAVIRTSVLPRWLGWLSALAAVLDAAATLTIFGGTGNNGPVGLLPLILGATPVVVWWVSVSIVLLGKAPQAGRKAVSSPAA
ncbi:MAG TPA: hypothetical protein VGU71_09150 [Candidatus Dormibacteraeota bacterium]|nr:hypothetical protein [Candidatus Dormibacteraeota bacterium]